MRVHATTQDEKKDANKAILSSVGKNLKNVVKAPIALTTRILKSSIVATVLFAPISLGLGILHAAWECMDSKKSPYEGKTATKLSQGFVKVMSKINTKVHFFTRLEYLQSDFLKDIFSNSIYTIINIFIKITTY